MKTLKRPYLSRWFESFPLMSIYCKHISLHFLRALNWFCLKPPSNQAIIFRFLTPLWCDLTLLCIALYITRIHIAFCTISAICTVDDWSVIVHSGCILAKWAQKTPIESHFEPLRWVEVKTFDFLKWSSLYQIMQIFTLTMMDDLFSASCLEWKCKNLDANFVSKFASKGGIGG